MIVDFINDWTFEILDRHAENIDIWTHEFTEGTIATLLLDEFSFIPYVLGFITHNHYELTIPHLLTSLACISGFNIGNGYIVFVTPEEFIESFRLSTKTAREQE